MKRKFSIFLMLLILAGVSACKKGEQLSQDTPGLINLELKGLVLGEDTLEFVQQGKVIATARESNFQMVGGPLTNPDIPIQVRRKSGTGFIGQISLTPSPFKQVKKVFYNGTTLADKLELTPVSDPKNMGFRLSFICKSTEFYGGPVDVEFFIYEIDFNTFETSFTSVKTLRDVIGDFGPFYELPELESTDVLLRRYAFKVYKAGTKELPYKPGMDLSQVNPEYLFGYMDNFQAGASQLLRMSPYLSGNILGDGYYLQNLADAF